MFLAFRIRASQQQSDFLCQPADATHRVVGETLRLRPIYRQHAEEVAAYEHWRGPGTGPKRPYGRQLAYIQDGIALPIVLRLAATQPDTPSPTEMCGNAEPPCRAEVA